MSTFDSFICLLFFLVFFSDSLQHLCAVHSCLRESFFIVNACPLLILSFVFFFWVFFWQLVRFVFMAGCLVACLPGLLQLLAILFHNPFLFLFIDKDMHALDTMAWWKPIVHTNTGKQLTWHVHECCCLTAKVCYCGVFVSFCEACTDKTGEAPGWTWNVTFVKCSIYTHRGTWHSINVAFNILIRNVILINAYVSGSTKRKNSLLYPSMSS